MTELLQKIAVIACRAGDLAKERRKNLTSAQIHTKATDTDLVTDVDREVEAFIREEIKKITPDYGFFGEESGLSRTDSPYCWIIDPIDGTTNFVHDLPFYSVSIGLRKGENGVLGAIYAPKLDELFLAEAGCGATLNGEKICVSSAEKLIDSVVGTGFSCVRAKRKFDNLELLPDIVHATCAFRRSGSAAMDLAYVAAGKLDAFWELGLQLYDLAAGEVLVREAGGSVSDMENDRFYPERGILASNGKIHEKMLEFFRIDGGLKFE